MFENLGNNGPAQPGVPIWDMGEGQPGGMGQDPAMDAMMQQQLIEELKKKEMIDMVKQDMLNLLTKPVRSVGKAALKMPGFMFNPMGSLVKDYMGMDRKAERRAKRKAR